MKILNQSLLAFCFTCLLMQAQAQRPSRGPGGGGIPGAPQFSSALPLFFGDHKAFTAEMLIEVNPSANKEASFVSPTKLAFLDGKSRIELDLSQSKGAQINPGMGAQLKAMGMGEMVIISELEKNRSCLVYPGLEAYAEVKTGENAAAGAKPKMSVTELGKETVDGHPAIKNKVTLTDPDGKTTEATVWNATDLKKFPVRIEITEGGNFNRMSISKVNFTKPEPTQFVPSSKFTRYQDAQTMMQEAVMKRMRGGAGSPPPGTKP